MNTTKTQEQHMIAGQPVWEVWEMSGRETTWLQSYRHKDARSIRRTISREEYEKLKAGHPDAPGIIEEDPSYEDEDTYTLVELPHKFYEEITTIPVPAVGTRIHFQTGVTAGSSRPFKAQVYRATFTGSAWNWEMSAETYARNLVDRVAGLIDSQYKACERPSEVSSKGDWYVL